LVKLLSEAPAEIGETLARAHADLAASHDFKRFVDMPDLSELVKNQTKVFCLKQLLYLCLYELLLNVKKHLAGQKAGHATLRVSIEQVEDQVRMVFRNDGTVPSPNPGRGLRVLSRRLSGFDAELRPERVTTDEFMVTLTLQHGV
jgi:signal transduction histidine kinase